MTAILLLSGLLAAGVLAVPSPESLGSDITILADNDLYGPQSSRQSAALVLSTPQSHDSAVSNCAALGEALWNPPSGNSSDSLDFLRYLDYGKDTDDVGVFWISSNSGSSRNTTCRTISTHGEVQDEQSCNLHFPALCSQSAALSARKNVDTSTRWRTAVRTGNATAVGYRDKLSFRFLGLQYGSIPARFAYPKYAPPRSNISALEYGPRCFQGGCGASGSVPCSEACLYLNIWTPYLPRSQSQGIARNKKKAVMVWIHGGGFTSGEGSDTTFDGGNLASRGDVVVVTINYRLSTLGFLALNSSSQLTGNYGIADQIVALEWVRAHIADFGGDKDRITVFGQSAGAASVRALLASPKAQGRFQGAILMSTPQGLSYAREFAEYLTIGEATAKTSKVLSETGCTQADGGEMLECLRGVDPKKLVTGTAAQNLVVDGTYLTTSGLALSASSPKSNITLMMGTMRDDGNPFTHFPTSRNASTALLDQGFNASAILSSGHFPVPTTGNTTADLFNLTSRVATDAMFRCLGQATASTAARHNLFRAVYAYEFDRAYQISEWSPNAPACEAPASAERPLGDVRLPYYRCHSGDLYYVFGTLLRQGRGQRDGDDVPFSRGVVDAWTAFARTGDPNPGEEFLGMRGFGGGEGWGRWRAVGEGGEGGVRVLDIRGRMEGWREEEQCEVLGLGRGYYG